MPSSMMCYYRPLIGDNCSKVHVDVNTSNFNRGPPPSLITTSYRIVQVTIVNFNNSNFQIIIIENSFQVNSIRSLSRDDNWSKDIASSYIAHGGIYCIES